tara:strand:+ start:1053 stop:1799 length:747 start_codon:yes stop_codon:yes gene_type:complete
MSSVLPVIEMPKKEPVAPPDKSEQEIPDNILPEQPDNMEIIDELLKEKEIDLDDIVQVDEHEIPTEEEVFREREPPRVEPIHEAVTEVKKGKRKYVRKAPMSDKQKDHLTKIRKIAQEKRKIERERRIQEKEDKLVEKAEKKILEKKQKAEAKQAEAKQEEDDNVKEPLYDKPKKISANSNNGFTKEDLDNAVFSAISQYDTLRKHEKKEKKQKELKLREEDKMRATLARAIQPQQRTNPDPWRNLFS